MGSDLSGPHKARLSRKETGERWALGEFYQPRAQHVGLDATQCKNILVSWSA